MGTFAYYVTMRAIASSHLIYAALVGVTSLRADRVFFATYLIDKKAICLFYLKGVFVLKVIIYYFLNYILYKPIQHMNI